jgi:hypothetical protein
MDHGWMELLQRALRGRGAVTSAGRPCIFWQSSWKPRRTFRGVAFSKSLAGLRAAGVVVVFLSVTAPPVRTLQVVTGESLQTSYSHAVSMAC